MEGIERLEKQLKEMDDDNVTAIFEYLKTRPDLDEFYRNKEKTIEAMYDYVCSKAEKKKKNRAAMVVCTMVYLWAVTYFTKSNEELGIKEKKKTEAKNDTNKKSTEVTENKQIKEAPKNNDNQISMFEEGQK